MVRAAQTTLDFVRRVEQIREQDALFDVDLVKQLGAAFQSDPSVGLLIDAVRNQKPEFSPVEGFNPYNEMTLPELDDPKVARVLGSARSPEELEWLRQRKEQLDRLSTILGNGPLPALVASFVAGLLDPINLIPLGGAVSAVRFTSRLATFTARGAAAGAAGQAMLEPFRYAADPFRDFGDTMMNILVGGGIGAGIGAVAGAVLGRSLARQAYEDAGMPPDLAEAMTRAGSDAFAAAAKADKEFVAKVAPDSGDGRSTVGAQRVIDEPLVVREALREELLTVAGPRYVSRLVSWLGRAIPGFRIPSAALATSPFATARKFVWSHEDIGILSRASLRDMDEAALTGAFERAQKKGFEGTFEEFKRLAEDVISTGLPVAEQGTWETNRLLWEAVKYDVIDAFRRKASELVKAGSVKSEKEFAEEVGRYMRYREEPEYFPVPPVSDPAVLKAAEEVAEVWQNRVAKPMLEFIKKSGVWADEPATQDAIIRELKGAYFPKVLDRYAIAADPVGFRDLLIGELEKAVRSARERYALYEQSQKIYANQRKAIREWISATVKSAARAPEDSPLRVMRELIRDVRQVDADFVSLDRQLRQTEKLGLRAWVEKITQRKELGDQLSAYEEDLLRQAEQRIAALTEAIQTYNSFRDAHLDVLRQAAGGKEPPKILVQKPVPYDGIESDRALLFGDDGSGVGLTTPEAIKARAEEIVSDILNAKYDLFSDLASSLRQYLKARTAQLNPNLFMKYLDTNFVSAVDKYVSIMARDLALAQTHGTIRLEKFLNRLDLEAREMIEAAASKEEAERLNKELERAKDFITHAWLTARGMFDVPRSTAGRMARNVATNLQSAAFMAYMGGGVIAQIGDLSTAILRYGTRRVIPNMVESLKAGITNATDKLTPEQLNKLATGMEYANLRTMHALYDIAPSPFAGPITRGVQKLTTVFARSTLMPALNDFLRRTGVRLADDLLTEDLSNLLAGRRISDELASSASIAGVNSDQLRRMAQLVEKYRSTIDQNAKLWTSNLESWFFKDPELGQAYRRLLHVVSQRMFVVASSLDTPTWTQTAIGKLVILFKRFAIASITKNFLPWLQSPSGRMAEVFIASMVLGVAQMMIRDLATSYEIKERTPAQWAFDAMSMSGLLSGLTEVDATLDRLVPGLGVKRMLTGEDYTRMQERSWMYGPDYRRFADLIGVMSRFGGSALSASAIPYTIASGRDPTEYQVRAFRELLPFQNHFLFRHFFDILEQSLGGREKSVILNSGA